MFLEKVILNGLLKAKPSKSIILSAAYSSSGGGFHNERLPIGKREWVGYGMNSAPEYVDRPDFPMPAVRFREITAELLPLKEKEKGDWKKLTLEEKKQLYRASFRQTLAEVDAPTGQWKSVLGWSLFFVSIGLWLFMLEKHFVLPPRPASFSDEWREKQLRKMLVNKSGHLSGVSSRWDYEKDDWKK